MGHQSRAVGEASDRIRDIISGRRGVISVARNHRVMTASFITRKPEVWRSAAQVIGDP